MFHSQATFILSFDLHAVLHYVNELSLLLVSYSCYNSHLKSSCFFHSGAIIKNFVTARKLMANFILEAFFSPSQVRNYINDKKRTYLTAEQIGKWWYILWQFRYIFAFLSCSFSWLLWRFPLFLELSKISETMQQ